MEPPEIHISPHLLHFLSLLHPLSLTCPLSLCIYTLSSIPLFLSQGSDLEEPPEIYREEDAGSLALNWLALVARVEGALALVSGAQGRYLRAREAHEEVPHVFYLPHVLYLPHAFYVPLASYKTLCLVVTQSLLCTPSYLLRPSLPSPPCLFLDSPIQNKTIHDEQNNS